MMKLITFYGRIHFELREFSRDLAEPASSASTGAQGLILCSPELCRKHRIPKTKKARRTGLF
jgi:hypothetical protein